MFYEKELDFFIKSMDSLKIRGTPVFGENLPDDIDFGIRRLLNLQDEYLAFFG